jgi:hypothetical protein
VPCCFRSVDGETRVGIFALRNIKIGEELTYDYKYVHLSLSVGLILMSSFSIFYKLFQEF